MICNTVKLVKQSKQLISNDVTDNTTETVHQSHTSKHADMKPAIKPKPVLPQFEVEFFPDTIYKVDQRVAMICNHEVDDDVTLRVDTTDITISTRRISSTVFIFNAPLMAQGFYTLTAWTSQQRLGRCSVGLEWILPDLSQFTCIQYLQQCLGMPNLQHLDCYLKSVFTSSSPDNDDWNAMFAQEPLYEPEDIYRKSEGKYPTMLHFAAAQGLSEFSTILLKCPGSFRASYIRNCDGCTPAHLAKGNNYAELAERILKWMEMKEAEHLYDECNVMPQIGKENNAVNEQLLEVLEISDDEYTDMSEVSVQYENNKLMENVQRHASKMAQSNVESSDAMQSQELTYDKPPSFTENDSFDEEYKNMTEVTSYCHYKKLLKDDLLNEINSISPYIFGPSGLPEIEQATYDLPPITKDDHIDDHMDDHIDDHRFSAEYLNTVEVSDMRTYEEFKSESFSNNNNISNEPLGIMSTTFKLSESISDSKRAPIATPSIGNSGSQDSTNITCDRSTVLHHANSTLELATVLDNTTLGIETYDIVPESPIGWNNLQELIDVAEMFKNKEINLNQVDLLFQSWKQRQSDNVAASVPEKQVIERGDNTPARMKKITEEPKLRFLSKLGFKNQMKKFEKKSNGRDSGLQNQSKQKLRMLKKQASLDGGSSRTSALPPALMKSAADCRMSIASVSSSGSSSCDSRSSYDYQDNTTEYNSNDSASLYDEFQHEKHHTFTSQQAANSLAPDLPPPLPPRTSSPRPNSGTSQ